MSVVNVEPSKENPLFGGGGGQGAIQGPEAILQVRAPLFKYIIIVLVLAASAWS